MPDAKIILEFMPKFKKWSAIPLQVFCDMLDTFVQCQYRKDSMVGEAIIVATDSQLH